jgi:hypothetical protein
MLLMQQILTRGVRVALTMIPLCSSVSCVVKKGFYHGGHRGTRRKLFPVRHPNVLNLRGMLQEPASLGHFGIEPVDGAAFVGEDLLQIPD